MKAVLISIQPKWCELIASTLNPKTGLKVKRIELRKNKPGIFFPFKCYIYQTKKVWTYDIYSRIANSQQKVIGEFICDCILSHCESENLSFASNLSCVSKEEIIKYSKGKEVFGWNISDLVIYDEPKELSEFYTIDNEAIKKCGHRERVYNNPDYTNCAWLLGSYICNKDEPNWCEKCKTKPLTKPPQSWCFVEELVGDNNA